MNQGSRKERLRSPAVFAAHCLAILLYCARPVSAQQLPFRHYGISEGLAGARVTSIYQDAKGYLWFGTWDGLSRYDGYRFQNYGLSDGIAHLTINAIVKDRRDRLWVATNGGGVARLIDESDGGASAQKKFLSQRIGDSIYSNRVNAMLFDTQNRLWLATDLGIYRGHAEANGQLRFEHVLPYPQTANDMTALADSHERLWFGIIHELYRFAGDRVTRYDARDEVARHFLRALSEDRQGRLFAASDFEAFEFIPGGAANDRGQWRRLPIKLVAGQEIRALAADATGALWIGTTKGLIKYFDRRQTLYTTAHGLRDDHIRALLEDREGNLWIGSWSAGVSKLPPLQPVSFTKQEGIVEQNIVKVMEDRQGRVYAMSDRGALFEITEGKAKLIPNSARPPFGGKVNTQLTQYLQDRRGDWWVGALDGLYHFPGPRLQLSRGRKLGPAQGIPKGFEIQGHVSGLYEDPAGNIWVGASKLYQLDAAHLSRPFFHALSLPDQVKKERLITMMKDRAGAL